MLYLNDNENKEIENFKQYKEFKEMQNKLSNCGYSLVNIKKDYTELFNSVDSSSKKIEQLKSNLANIEKKVDENYIFFKSAIDAITKHLAIVENKQRGRLDKIKFWKKQNDINESMNKLYRQSPVLNKNFNFND